MFAKKSFTNRKEYCSVFLLLFRENHLAEAAQHNMNNWLYRLVKWYGWKWKGEKEKSSSCSFCAGSSWVNFWIPLNGGLDDMGAAYKWFLKCLLLKIWAQGKRNRGKLYPSAVWNESELLFIKYLIPETWWKPEAISRLTRTLLCIFLNK